MRLTALLLVCAFFLLGATAHAEVIELEGTIKSIDAEKREITMKLHRNCFMPACQGKTKVRRSIACAGLRCQAP